MPRCPLKGPEKQNKANIVATTAKHPYSRSQIWRYGHSRPQSLRSFWPAAGIESSWSNHFVITKEITEFCPSGLTQSSSIAHARNGCSQSSQSSRFLPQARRIIGSGDENALRLDATDVHAVPHFGGNLLPAAATARAVSVCLNSCVPLAVKLVSVEFTSDHCCI